MDAALQHISSPKDYIRCLFEEAYGASIAELGRKWKEYECYGLDEPKRSKLCLAYHYAQDFKEELDFYGLLVFYYTQTVERNLSSVRKELYEEALRYCKTRGLKNRLEEGLTWCERDHRNASLVGFSEEAATRVEGISLFYEKIGKDASLHDAFVRNFNFDRDKNIMTMVIDTFGVYDDSNNDTQLITIEFCDIVSINMNVDPESDYAWEFRCYIDINYLVFELNSAHIEVKCSKMKIVSIEYQ